MPDENPDVIEGDAEEQPIWTPLTDEEERERNERAYREVRKLPEPPSTDLEVRPPGNKVLMPLDTEQVVAGMEAYQAMLPKLLTESDWQDAGRDGRFVKKSGWRKIARAFNLSVMVVSVRIERDVEGNPTRAETIARAMAPNGQVSDADGYCSADEKRFEQPRGRQKLENDLRATATTRAKNRAISDLVGMGEVSAEEIVPGGSAEPQFRIASEVEKESLRTDLKWLLPPGDGREVWGKVKAAFGGELYGPAVDAICTVIRAHKANMDFEQREAEEAAAEVNPAEAQETPKEEGK